MTKALYDAVTPEVLAIFENPWDTRAGIKVPESIDVRLEGNDAVTLEGTVLYADLAESTDMVDRFAPWFAAEVYRTYLRCAGRAITRAGGTITSYDGDRIMAVFLGDYKESSAVLAALQIYWCVKEIINVEMKRKYREEIPEDFEVRQAVGIDTSPLFIARTGIRGHNDLVWVGRAANYAAKLCGKRDGAYATWITEDVYRRLDDLRRVGVDGLDMWANQVWWPERGIYIRGSNYYWLP